MIERAPRSENRMTYNEALLYCQFLEHNGHKDWRLPTYAEDMHVSPWYSAAHWGWYLCDYAANDTTKYRVAPVRDTTILRYITYTIKTLYDRICTRIRKNNDI